MFKRNSNKNFSKSISLQSYKLFCCRTKYSVTVTVQHTNITILMLMHAYMNITINA